MNDIFLGASHITDLAGFDHILFLVALAAAFDLSNLGRMALLATAFYARSFSHAVSGWT